MAAVVDAVGVVVGEEEKGKPQEGLAATLKEVAEEKVTEDEKVKGEEVAVEREKAEKEEDAKGEGGMEVEVEAKTGVSFPLRLDDGKRLAAVGLRKKSVLGFGLKIYAFGIYADNAKLKEALESKLGGTATSPETPTKELYDAIIDNDAGMTVRLVIVFGGLTMSLVRKSFSEGIGASLQKLTGGQKNDELVNQILGAATDSIKLPSGSVIEIARFPGYILQTKVKGEVVSRVESELLCRAYFHMYLGDEPFDKDAKERFGRTMLSLY